VTGEAAQEVVAEMREEGLRISAFTYGHLMVALIDDGNFLAAKLAFHTAVSEGLPPPPPPGGVASPLLFPPWWPDWGASGATHWPLFTGRQIGRSTTGMTGIFGLGPSLLRRSQQSGAV